MAFVISNQAMVWDIDYRKCCKKKVNRNFWAAYSIGMKLCRYLDFHESFLHDGLNQVDSIFSSKVIILPKNSAKIVHKFRDP